MPTKSGYITTMLSAATLCACGGGSSDGNAAGDAAGGVLTAEHSKAVQSFVIERAKMAYARQQQGRR